ncbi:hypothetical protein LS482_05205 [Sinomicrobium kalidii]|uniref:hypothetical protein n=1 Tax=Sinomicrobium kalidii TaxID=2900738 RepID=UPI001E31E445|nr:hypothetical protein [Sinomicrobium kalidii]UGU17268.1 hypothetical protein LS482_05205 [Sinomicrobium kalidii]
MKPLDFEAYKDTLKTNAYGETYVELKVDSYETLALMRYYVSHAIQLIAETHEHHKQGDDMAFSLYYLTQILKSTTPLGECYGLDRTFEA